MSRVYPFPQDWSSILAELNMLDKKVDKIDKSQQVDHLTMNFMQKDITAIKEDITSMKKEIGLLERDWSYNEVKIDIPDEEAEENEENEEKEEIIDGE